MKSILYVSIAAAASLSLSSCLDDDGEPTEIIPGYLSFVNSMADTTELDFYVGGEQLGDSPIRYRGQYPTSSYVQAAPYDYQFDVAFPDDQQSQLRGNVPVYPDTYRTLYVYNTNDDVKAVLVEDDLGSPTSGKAKVRFINLAADAPNIDLTIEGETEPLFTDYEVGEGVEAAEAYEELDAGSYMVQITDTDNGDELATGSVTLEDSKVYTLWLGGIYEGTEEKALSLESIEHEKPDLSDTTANPNP